MGTKKTMRWAIIVGAGVGTWITFTVLANVSLAQKAEDGPPRVAPVRFLMSGINNPNCAAIAELLKEEGPKDDKSWEQVAVHASVLNEAGHLLMQNNRCPDKIWADATGQLRNGAAAVYDAAMKKDLAAAREAFKTTTASCGACHAAHKDKKTEPVVERVASVGTLMRSINKPHCGNLGKLIKDSGPADDQAWADVVDSASMLNEVSYALMDNNRCPDAVWKKACEQLRAGSMQIVVAARAKDLPSIQKAFQEVTGACSSCHAAHKKPAV